MVLTISIINVIIPAIGRNLVFAGPFGNLLGFLPQAPELSGERAIYGGGKSPERG